MKRRPYWRAGSEASPCSNFFNRRCRGQRNAGGKDQRHLHGEGENGPDAVIPGGDDLNRRGIGPDQGGRDGDEGQQQGVEIGSGMCARRSARRLA